LPISVEKRARIVVPLPQATTLKARGDLPAATAMILDNHAAKIRVLGPEHRDTCLAALNLVALWITAGRLDEAEALLAPTLATLSRDLGATHPSTLSAVMRRACVCQERGQHAEATEILQRVHTAFGTAYGDDHPDTMKTAWRLGALKIIQGAATAWEDLFDALDTLETTAGRQRKVLGPAHPDTAKTLVSVGRVVLLLVEVESDPTAAEVAESQDRAAGLFKRALAVQSAALHPDHPDLAETKALLARLCCSKHTVASSEVPTAGVIGADEELSKWYCEGCDRWVLAQKLPI